MDNSLILLIGGLAAFYIYKQSPAANKAGPVLPPEKPVPTVLKPQLITDPPKVPSIADHAFAPPDLRQKPFERNFPKGPIIPFYGKSVYVGQAI